MTQFAVGPCFVFAGTVLIAVTGCSAEEKGQSATHRALGEATSALEVVDGLTISDEQTLEPPTYGPDTVSPSRPSFGLDSYLVTSIAGLNYQTPATAASYGMAPIATRVARDGTILDPLGIWLSASDQLADTAGTAFDGANWLSFWTEPIAGNLRCARVRPDGTVLDPGGVIIETNYGTVFVPKHPLPPVFDGNHVLLLADSFVFVDSACQFVSEVASPISTSALLGVAFDGQNYRVLYTDPWTSAASSYSFFLQTFSTAGAAVGDAVTIDTIPRPSPSTSRWVGADLTVHAGTTGIAYAFGEDPDPCAGFPSPCGSSPPPSKQARFRSVALNGTLGTAQSLPTHGYLTPNVAALDDGFLVTDTYSVEHLATDGTLIASSSESSSNLLASDGTKTLFVYPGFTSTLDQNLNLSTGASLLNIAATTSYPSIAATADTALVTFVSTAPGGDARAVRFGKSGALLDSNALVLGQYAAETNVGTNGTEFLAAWATNDEPRIRARLVSSGGDLGPAFQLGTTGDMFVDRRYPRVASNGSDFLVVWAELTSLVGARVSAGGSTLDTTTLPVLDGFSGNPSVAVAFDGQRYVVATGDQSGGAGMRLVFVTPSTGATEVVALPWDGEVCGLAWADDHGMLLWSPNSGAPPTASRIDRSGSVSDGISVSLGTSWVTDNEAQIAWNGSVYLVTRTDPTNGTGWLARITSTGTLLDAGGIPLADGYQWPPTSDYALASFGGDSLVAYARLDSTPDYRSFQTRARFLRGSGLPSAAGAGGTGAGGTGAGTSGTGGSGPVDGEGGGGPVDGEGGSEPVDGEGGANGGVSNATGGNADSAGATDGGSDAGAAGLGGDGFGGSDSVGSGGRNVVGTGGSTGGVATAGRGGGGASAGHAGQSMTGSNSSGEAGGASTSRSPAEDSGCGCHVATRRSDAPSPALALLGLLALRRRRSSAQRR